VHLAEFEAKSVLITDKNVRRSARRILQLWLKTDCLVPLGFLLPPPPTPNTDERLRFDLLVSTLFDVASEVDAFTELQQSAEVLDK
jgi:hypothetical protein